MGGIWGGEVPNEGAIRREGKKMARLRSKDEVKMRNLKLREMTMRTMSTGAAIDSDNDNKHLFTHGDNLYAIKVSVCPELRESLHLNGREKRGRMFVERGSSAAMNLAEFRQTLHDFFRALKKGEYLIEYEDGEEVEMAMERVEGDDDVERMFRIAEERWEEEKRMAAGDEGVTVQRRPTVNLHIVPNPEHVRVEWRPEWMKGLAEKVEKSKGWSMISFYSFPPGGIRDPETFAENLRRVWKHFGALGRVYVAEEGVNAQMSVPSEALETFKEVCMGMEELACMENGINVDEIIECGEFEEDRPFKNLHVRVRNQVLADGLGKELDWEDAGWDMTAEDWHEKIKTAGEENGPILLDCRNDYETGVGRFVNAEPLGTETFKDTWDKLRERLDGIPKDREVMTYCTGGIRCVKVGAWLKQEMGFENVGRLKGGVIGYDRMIRERGEGKESLFQGTNYVFDGRVGRQITDHKLGDCITCGAKTSLLANCNNDACHKRMVQCENCRTSFEGCCGEGCKKVFVGRLDRTTARNGAGMVCGGERETTMVEFDPEVFDDVQGYCEEHSTGVGELYDAIQRNTELHLPTGAHMVSSGIQGRLLRTMAGMGNGNVLEIGTFTGYATCCFAEGVKRGGRVVSLERDPRACEIAWHHIRAAKEGGWGGKGRDIAEREITGELGGIVEMETGTTVEILKVDDALVHLEGMEGEGGGFDLVFVDADKGRLLEYVDVCVRNENILAEGGVILVDNVLWKGAVVEGGTGGEGVEDLAMEAQEEHEREQKRLVKLNRRRRKLARIMHEFNQAVCKDDRLDVTMLPLRDGLTIIRRRRAQCF